MNLLNGTPNKVDSPSQVQMLNQVDLPTKEEYVESIQVL